MNKLTLDGDEVSSLITGGADSSSLISGLPVVGSPANKKKEIK
jgi:hypothetical protein